MATLSEWKNMKDDVCTRLKQNNGRLEQGIGLFQTVVADLTSGLGQYSTPIAEMQAAAQANPTSTAYAMAADESAIFLAEAQAMLARATALKNAVQGI